MASLHLTRRVCGSFVDEPSHGCCACRSHSPASVYHRGVSRGVPALLFGALLGACSLSTDLDSLSSGGGGETSTGATGGGGGIAGGGGDKGVAGGGEGGLGGATSMGGAGGSGGSSDLVVVSFGSNAGDDFQNHFADAVLKAAGKSGNNYGAAIALWLAESSIGHNVSLIHVDVSRLPAGIEIVSAELTLTVKCWNIAPSLGVCDDTARPVTPQVFVTQLTEPWDEGTLNGQSGEASYNRRKPGISWSTAGGSHDAVVLASFEPSLIGAKHEIAIDEAVVQAWVDSPDDNHGLRFEYVGEAAVAFSSSEALPPNTRPRFVVTYRVP